MAVAGILMIILALYPYLVVGRTPEFFTFQSRHQLTLLVCYGFFFFFLVQVIFRRYYPGLFTAILVSFFVMINFKVNSDHLVDAHSQNAIISRMAEINEVRENTLFIFDTTKRQGNPIPDIMNRFVEISNWMRKSLGSDTRLGIHCKKSNDRNTDHWISYMKSVARKYQKWQGYGHQGFHEKGGIFFVDINRGEKSFSISRAIRLSFRRIFSPKDYQKEIRNFVEIRVWEIDSKTWKGSCDKVPGRLKI